jgi:hypothetical protein
VCVVTDHPPQAFVTALDLRPEHGMAVQPNVRVTLALGDRCRQRKRARARALDATGACQSGQEHLPARRAG